MEQLKKLRQTEGLTLKEMAKKCGMSESLYQKLEYGIKKPSTNAIRKIKCAYPNIDANIFFTNQYHDS